MDDGCIRHVHRAHVGNCRLAGGYRAGRVGRRGTLSRRVYLAAAARRVDRVLLSSEPFMFRKQHLSELRSQLNVPIDLIDGEMTSWYGSRAIRGLAYLRTFRTAHLYSA